MGRWGASPAHFGEEIDTNTEIRPFSREARANLLEAAMHLVYCLDNLTTAQFAEGGDRERREQLRAALVAYTGLPWTEQSYDDDDDSPNAC